jgi:hypothetical protein
MGSATATRNRLAPITEIYFGGAGDARSRLVMSYAEARRLTLPDRPVLYFQHREARAASAAIRERTASGQRVALVGHSWGADAMLAAARGVAADGLALLIGADPVARPGSWLLTASWQAGGPHLLHVAARTDRPDRSDAVKAAGLTLGGGIPRAFRLADAFIQADANHWNFSAMMRARGRDGLSAEDWLARL